VTTDTVAQRVNETCDWGEWAELPWDSYTGYQRESRRAQVAAVFAVLRKQVEADREAHGHLDAVENPSAYPGEVARDARAVDARFKYALALLGGAGGC
jgi:hypothetical protein